MNRVLYTGKICGKNVSTRSKLITENLKNFYSIKCVHLSMNHLEVFMVIQFFFLHVRAQDNSDLHVLKPLHPSPAVIIGILSVMFSLTFFILVYAKLCSTTMPSLLSHHHNPQGLLRSMSRFSGIDRTVIESLPLFVFSSLKGSKEGLECVVCLSKFEDTEILRLLPNCKHAFHMNCIDQWLENNSSCPLCRYKFDVSDITSLNYSNSLRYPQSPLNLTEDPNHELFVQRQQDHQKSSSFNLGSSFQNFATGKNKELLIQEGNNSDSDQTLLDKFKHKIIVSDIMYKSRWSDVNSSDLMFLNSEMLDVMSSTRFSSMDSKSGRFHHGFAMNEVKIKEDIERKKLYESKVSSINRSYSLSTSSFASASNSEANQSTTSRLLNPADKRSMSEITNLSRFTEFSMRNRIKESMFSGNNGKDERMRSLWLLIGEQFNGLQVKKEVHNHKNWRAQNTQQMCKLDRKIIRICEFSAIQSSEARLVGCQSDPCMLAMWCTII